MNACDSGRLGVGLTGLDGWAEAFIAGDGGKAGVFIGSVWQTTDELASQFAAVFYERLLAGDPLAEAMRQARAAVRRFGDATYLSYTLYANPKVRAARATLPA
jgi:CHAT domain-containing protein